MHHDRTNMSVLLATDQDAWQLDIAQRQEDVACTLRHLLAAAPDASAAVSRSDAGSTQPRMTSVPMTDPASVADFLTAVDTARAGVAPRLLRRPLMAARRVNVAIDRLRAATSYADLLHEAMSELCWAGDFDRVLFSRVAGSHWFPTAWHASTASQGADELAFAEFMHGSDIALSSGMIEAEVVRRRASALVSDTASEPRAFPPIVQIARSGGYVVAPVVSADAVVGLLHADTNGTGRPLSDSDRVILGTFADSFGLTMERLSLVERLGTQRQQIKAALAVAADVVDDICRTPVGLTFGLREDVTAQPTRIGELPDDGLTAREREVFALLIGGATNGQIADRLTISETTVKSHVKHILRKLRVANRAEAIAQYLATSGSTGVS
jgi:DNA-binding CsgD family transcriptional regulator